MLFDLDDTLYPQSAWLSGAWAAVADQAFASGLDRASVLRSLEAVAAEGSDRGRIIDRAVSQLGIGHVPVEPLVAAFRAYIPVELSPYPMVPASLAKLRAAVPIGLVSDGDVDIQRRKLAALGLSDAFDVVVWSDDLGGQNRKPQPAPFMQALELLALPAAEVVHVGDRPDKDVAGAQAVGMRTVRVMTGEYAAVEDDVRPWMTELTAADAIRTLLTFVGSDAGLNG